MVGDGRRETGINLVNLSLVIPLILALADLRKRCFPFGEEESNFSLDFGEREAIDEAPFAKVTG